MCEENIISVSEDKCSELGFPSCSVSRLTCDDSDDAGVELVLVGGAFVFVGEAFPACEGGRGEDFDGKKITEEVVDVAVGVGAAKLKVVTGWYIYSTSQVQLV